MAAFTKVQERQDSRDLFSPKTNSASMFQPPKGTRDFLPVEWARRRAYFEKARAVLERYGYGEVMTPAIETLQLLEAKGAIGGEAVKDVFRILDKGTGKPGYGLIFDPTVPIARIIAADRSMKKPVKWFYVRPMWRYEQFKVGRYREFWQAGAELIGSSSPMADAEILSATHDVLKALGVKNFSMQVNSRRIIESLARLSGIPKEKWMDAFKAVDKLEKVGRAEVGGEMKRAGIPDDSIEKFLNYADRRNVNKAIKELSDDIDAAEQIGELREILRLAKLMGVDNAEIDFSIIRGLDYYTGFIFETIVKGQEKLGSVASGGRYDKLIELYGGQPTPATGVGIGIDRMMEILPEPKEYSQAKAYVVCVYDNLGEKALEVAQLLRKSGVSTDLDYNKRDLKKQFEFMNAQKIPYAVIVGPKELKKNSVVLRDMKSGKEKVVKLSQLVKAIEIS